MFMISLGEWHVCSTGGGNPSYTVADHNDEVIAHIFPKYIGSYSARQRDDDLESSNAQLLANAKALFCLAQLININSERLEMYGHELEYQPLLELVQAARDIELTIKQMPVPFHKLSYRRRKKEDGYHIERNVDIVEPIPNRKPIRCRKVIDMGLDQ